MTDCRRKDKACLNFPCLISALCNKEGVSQLRVDIFTPNKIGWTRKEYMKTMNITEAVLGNFAMPQDDDEIPAEHASLADPEPRQAQEAEPEPTQQTIIAQQLTRISSV
ncbi:hypothetical protein V6N13_104714 [Hibiscus sabdariffa]